MITDILYELIKAMIIIAGIIMAYAEFSQAIIYKKSWVKWGLGFIGIYWSIYYTYSLVQATMPGLRLPSHQIFVRSGILLTISFVAAGAIMTLKTYKRFK